jgi:hypothetical protein
MIEVALWLGFYLFVGVAALWACQKSSACRRQTRLDRNQRIVSGLASLFGTSGISAARPRP